MSALNERFVGPLHISVWHGAATIADVQRMQKTIVDFRHRCALLLVVPPQTPLSGPEARAAAIALIRERQAQIGSVAIVLEGGGFWNAAVRSMFGGIATAARPGIPWHIHSDSDVGAAWVSDRLEESRQEPPPFLKIVHSVRELRSPPPAVPRASAFP